MAEILKVNRVTSIDKLVGKKLNPFTLKLIGSDYHIAFDATSLYSSAMALLHATYLDGDNIKFLT